MKLPPRAENEILEKLSADLQISSEEIAEILRKNGVSQNTDTLQRGYRKRIGQRYLSTFRDEQGNREILAVPNGKGGMDYVVVDCCNDPKKLQAIQRKLNAQMTGLSNSSHKVKGRIRILRRFRKGENHWKS